MRRLDVLATAGLMVVPFAAMLLLGPSTDREPMPLEPAPRQRADRPVRAPEWQDEQPVRRVTSPKPRSAPAAPRAAAQPRTRESGADPTPTDDELWGPAKSFDDDSPAGQAASLFSDGEYAQAILAAQGCLTKEPDNKSCEHTLLMSYMRTEAYAHATKVLDKCLDRNPDDVTCLGQKLNVLVKRGKHDRARAVAERILEVAPDGMWGSMARGLVNSSAK